MSEKYIKIFSLENKLYTQGAPIVIKAGALLKDNESGGLIAQLKLQNISDNIVKFAKVELTLLDTLGRPLDNLITFDYLDLLSQRCDEFGTKTPIRITNLATRSYTVNVVEVGFIDNSVWHNNQNAFEPIPNQNEISSLLNNAFAFKGYKSLFGSKANMCVSEHQDLWCCTCGEINHANEERCCKCGVYLKDLQSIENDTLVNEGIYVTACEMMNSTGPSKLDEAIECFSKITGYKDSDILIQRCTEMAEKLKIKDSDRQKKIKLYSFISLGLVLIGLLGYFAIYPLISYWTGNYKVYIDMYNVEEFEIPNGVTSIRNEAFYNCRELKTVTIPNSVTSIGKMAFYNCHSLSNITIPHGVTTIGSSAFDGCESITDITIPDGVTTIESWTFGGCISLKNITIPSSVTSIGDCAFKSCHTFTSITIPDSITTLGDYAFSGCRSLQSVNIGNGVTAIGERAFESCTNLRNVTVGNRVTGIGYRAFYGCENLHSITIPDSVTSVGDEAFLGCSNLSNLSIGNGVTRIGDDAFHGCSDLLSVKMPEGVISIGDCAFAACYELTYITIPKSVISIGEHAFVGSFRLQKIYYCGSEAEWQAISKGGRLFDYDSSCTIVYNYG